MNLKIVSSFIILIGYVESDLYIQNPRGSNNRFNENTRPRKNANRLFDSQNNERGGYNVGSLYYYPGSVLSIEWTNQHSCADANSHCELIIQYMCHDNLRDGTRTDTIPEDNKNCYNKDCNTDMRYGMHETYSSYTNCKSRSRNKGLFLADQKLKGLSAKYTRQNPGGTRRGYECPEERDYYPYWHHSEWKDVAILTTDVSRCEMYLRESQNVKARYACHPPRGWVVNNNNYIPITQDECEKLEAPIPGGGTSKGEWKIIEAHDIAAPDCKYAPWSRDNHLGNGKGGFANTYNWTIPDNVHENCALRMRYNISTGDYDAWNASILEKVDVKLNMAAQVRLEEEQEASNRGYVLKNNPQVQAMNGNDDLRNKLKLQLAVNTAQYGRVFQDRTHSFSIRKRPADIPDDGVIHNLNVRGKRGNIVQVYPATEYDFVPNRLHMSKGDFVHIQWTGSDTNPQNNDGQGRAGTDRSNFAGLVERPFDEGKVNHSDTIGHIGTNFPYHIDSTRFIGLSRLDVSNLALLGPGGDNDELDDAGTYFDLGPRKITSVGTHHYMCTRNNNFSNRSQKGRICVASAPMTEKQIGYGGGKVAVGANYVWFDQDMVEGNIEIQVKTLTGSEGEQWMEDNGGTLRKNMGDEYSSEFIVIQPVKKFTKGDKQAKVSMKVKITKDAKPKIYHSINDGASWSEIDADIDDNGVATFNTAQGGMFVARQDAASSPFMDKFLIPVVISVSVVVLLAIGITMYCRFVPGAKEKFRERVRYAKQSTQNQI